MRKSGLIICLFISGFQAYAQILEPGFNGKEYMDMLSLSFQRYDTSILNPNIPVPSGYRVVFRSPELGLKNRWNMWYRDDNLVAVIALRGTINELPSWLENFYAAMIPATGTLQLSDSITFKYKLAADSKANVHVGWVLGLGFLAPTIVEQVNLAYSKGIHDFVIAGHSQGGALALLTRSYLYYLTEQGVLPKDIHFKTYGSAAPKPGNLYYAYDFDFITRQGWAFTVVNAADWVPESPFSIQTLSDFNSLNPFININDILKSQPFFARLYLRIKYNKMKNKTRKAQIQFEKTTGHLIYKQVKKILPELKAPAYAHDNNYQRAGSFVVLMPDANYFQKFPNETRNVFQHHLFAPYYYLARQYYGLRK